MHKKIVRALLEVEKAQDALKNVLREVRLDCRHECVLEVEWEPFTADSHLNARRICIECGLEEEGHPYPADGRWSNVLSTAPTILGNAPGRVIHEVTRKEFYKHRID